MNDAVVEVVDVDFKAHGHKQQKTSLPHTLVENNIYVLI
jgi:hypothetical protein